MKLTSRHAVCVFALAIPLVLGCTSNLMAEPQFGRGRQPYDAATYPNYQQGLRDGQSDRANNQAHQYRYRTDPRNNNVAENRAYDAGYDEGYGARAGQFGQYNDRNRNYNTNSRWFQEGLRDGQGDRASNRQQQYRLRGNNNPNSARTRDYQAGYDQGYNGNNRRFGGQYDPRRNGQYGQGQYGQGQYGQGQYGQGQYGQYGNINNTAARNGQQDGLFDGQKDRQTGHSNRPTQGDWYKSATRGYDNSLGDREQYKVAYRNAYLPAYQRGYTGQ